MFVLFSFLWLHYIRLAIFLPLNLPSLISTSRWLSPFNFAPLLQYLNGLDLEFIILPLISSLLCVLVFVTIYLQLEVYMSNLLINNLGWWWVFFPSIHVVYCCSSANLNACLDSQLLFFWPFLIVVFHHLYNISTNSFIMGSNGMWIYAWQILKMQLMYLGSCCRLQTHHITGIDLDCL